jgi:hypothetical protein
VFNKPTDAELENRFMHHPPHGDQAERYGAIRAKILETAKFAVEKTPCCPEQTRALNALDEAMMLFNAAIARHEGDGSTPAEPAEKGKKGGKAKKVKEAGEVALDVAAKAATVVAAAV